MGVPEVFGVDMGRSEDMTVHSVHGAGALIHAVLRPRSRTIRVWQGHRPSEDFTIDEARALCVAGDRALLCSAEGIIVPPGSTTLSIPVNDERERSVGMPVERYWLVAFLAAIRGALRTIDIAERLAICPDEAGGSVTLTCIDDRSEPGSWERHLRHMAPMREAGPL